MNTAHRIALLSTGDELIFGDILNTNSQKLAQGLFDRSLSPGTQTTAGDEQIDIERAIKFLLNDHQALIITGGLGPTSDDRTRFALSQVLGTELEFNQVSWQRVLDRLNKLSLAIPETNRQQCLFPKGAAIFPNEHGTADGCMVFYKQKPIFMLPGPPFECFPIFEKFVIPYLLENNFNQVLYRRHWLLLGVSEGLIAAQLDPLTLNSNCTVGYRINWPYLEVKLHSADPIAFETTRVQFELIIEPFSISQNKEAASTQLKKNILERQLELSINDQATGGRLESLLLDPETSPFIHFDNINLYLNHITITGLDNYWKNRPEEDILNLEITLASNTNLHKDFKIINKKERTLSFVIELISWQILSMIRIW